MRAIRTRILFQTLTTIGRRTYKILHDKTAAHSVTIWISRRASNEQPTDEMCYELNRNSGPTAHSSIFILFDFIYSPERFGRYTLNSYYVVCTTFFWQYWRRSRRRRYTVVQRLNAQEPKDTTERPQFITNNNETTASVCGCAIAE